MALVFKLNAFALLLALVACTGSKFGGASDEREEKQGDKEEASEEKADDPQQVAGAFLTCESIDEGATTAYGCGVKKDDAVVAGATYAMRDADGQEVTLPTAEDRFPAQPFSARVPKEQEGSLSLVASFAGKEFQQGKLVELSTSDLKGEGPVVRLQVVSQRGDNFTVADEAGFVDIFPNGDVMLGAAESSTAAPTLSMVYVLTHENGTRTTGVMTLQTDVMQTFPGDWSRVVGFDITQPAAFVTRVGGVSPADNPIEFLSDVPDGVLVFEWDDRAEPSAPHPGLVSFSADVTLTP
jgi:hypothetical protein